jgi:tyrosyl-tRNA synthetase
MYGRTLSIPDDIIYLYYNLATDTSKKELAEIKKQLDDPNVNPRDIKRKLARTFIEMYYNEEEANKAEKEFDKVFIKKEVPDDILEIKLNDKELSILDLILKVKFAPSKGEAKRLVIQGGVTIDGKKVNNLSETIRLADGMVLKVGKRKFIKIKL